MIKFLDLYKQYTNIEDEILEAISCVIKNTAFINGKYVENFEKNFAEYQHAKYCIGVGNGTDALEIAIEALDLPEGSEILVPANSFIASGEAVTRSGCVVKFCDNNADNYTISIEDIKRKISDKTSAIMAVHLYGHPCDMDEILDVARENNLKVIEDCAQAHGAEYKGKRVGAIGNIGTFSFYPGKNLGAYGDAGAIVTNDEALSRKCRMIANHGRIEKYNHEFEGRNSRMDGIQGAILDVKLKYLDKWTSRRMEIARYYLENIKNEKIILPKIEDDVKHVFHLFVLRCDQRNDFQKYLQDNEIQSGIHYPIALPKLKAYEYLNQYNEVMSANKYDELLLSIPIGDHLEKEDLEYVVEKINLFS